MEDATYRPDVDCETCDTDTFIATDDGLQIRLDCPDHGFVAEVPGGAEP